MEQLNGWSDYIRLFALVAVLGAIGGIAFELLQSRRGRTGLIERPMKVGKGYVDLGAFASALIGAIAAVAALWIFPPEVVTITSENGITTTTRQYDIVKAVGLSLIVGSAGGSFLTAMQARALALVKSEQAAATQRVATRQMDDLKDKVNEGVSSDALAASVDSARKAIEATVDSGPGNPRYEDF